MATRIASRWPVISEIVGVCGQYDYVEYVAEYAPFGTEDFENLARACELHGLGSIVKIDFQNRAYVAQKALAAGIEGILFTDCKTPEEVRDCIYATTPDTPEDGGRFGFPNYRWKGYRPMRPQLEHAQEVRECVRLFMIEKKEAVDNIEAICDIPGVDMIQFGPSDYSLSCGRNASDYRQEFKAAERHCIEVALQKGVHPRCEIYSPDEAKYYLDLGVKHFCLGDQLKILRAYWAEEGAALRQLISC